MKVCVITDNIFLYENFLEIIKEPAYNQVQFDFYFSKWNRLFLEKYADTNFRPLALKLETREFFEQYSLFLSLHGKQIFPPFMVKEHRCINVHPGFNPYNRGWYPQVFGILNKKPVGVTIHEIDSELDHGPIIVQKEIEIHAWETSYDVYQKIQKAEVELLRLYLPQLLTGEYQVKKMAEEGNINLAKDFEALKEISLDREATYGQVLDYLRAMTFRDYKNAYFIDEKGNKVYVTIQLEKEDKK